MDHESSIIALAAQFPILKQAPGVSPWDPKVLEVWAATPATLDARAGWAARFVLNLWNSTEGWQAGWFDAYQAFEDWDEAHRRAFLSRAQAPFHPWP
jgi:hypothetical protein